MPRGSKGLTAGQRRALRINGNLDEYNAERDATPAEHFLYLAAVHYRECRVYLTESPGAIAAAREMLKFMAVAVVWERDKESAIDRVKVKALMMDFVNRAKNDPPF